MSLTVTYTNDQLHAKYGHERVEIVACALRANTIYPKGTVLGEITSNLATAVQTITRSGTPTSGTFALSFGTGAAYSTNPLAHSTTAAQLQAALEALPNIGKGGVTVGLAGQVYTITFAGSLAGKPQPNFVVTQNSLDNAGAITLTVATTTAGVQKGALGPYDDNANDGRQVARGILLEGVATGPDGRIAYSNLPGISIDHRGTTTLAAVALKGGLWDTSQLVGLDANGVVDLGRLVRGTVAAGLLSLA